MKIKLIRKLNTWFYPRSQFYCGRVYDLLQPATLLDSSPDIHLSDSLRLIIKISELTYINFRMEGVTENFSLKTGYQNSENSQKVTEDRTSGS